MKKYIKSAKLPQFYEYSDYRFKIGDAVHVSQYWGDPVDIQGVVYDIHNDVLYIVPKDMYVEGKKDYAWDNEIDLNADGLSIDLIPRKSESLDLKVGDVVRVKGNPKNPYNDNWCYEGIIEDMKDGWWKIRDEDGYAHQLVRTRYGDPIFTLIDKDIKLPGKLFKHTFFGDGEHHSKQEIIDFLRNTDKPIKYTYGLGYRNPTTHNKPITLQEALDIVDKEYSMLDVEERPKYVHLNAYGENDMW